MNLKQDAIDFVLTKLISLLKVLKKRVNETTKKLNIHEPDQTDKDKAIGLLLQRAIDKKVEFVRSEGSYEEFKLCAELCFSNVKTREFWKNNCSRVPVSKFITVADEALTLLILENNCEEWIAQVELKETQNPAKKRRLTRYTGKGRKVDGTKKGWTLEGKKRFNDIFDVIKNQRKLETSTSRESNMMKEWGGAAEEKSLRLRAGATSNKEEEIQKEMDRIREEENFVPRYSFGV